MILFPDRILEFAVGGERMEISRAVPRRIGTRGVSSSPTSGGSLLDASRSSSWRGLDWEWAAVNSNASMSPGVITMLHSFG